MQQQSSDWEGGVALVAISFEPPERLARLSEGFTDEFEFVSDTSRAIYRMFGLDRAGWRDLLSPRTIAYYAAAFFRGHWFRKSLGRPGESTDRFELGGDVIIDTDGVLRMIHRSTEPADRPSSTEIERIIQQSVHSPVSRG